MNIEFEVTRNPGEHALFVTQVQFERCKDIYHPQDKAWWSLRLTWWLFPRRRFRRWLWSWHKHDDKGMWYTLTLMCLGFEITWQWRRKSR